MILMLFLKKKNLNNLIIYNDKKNYNLNNPIKNIIKYDNYTFSLKENFNLPNLKYYLLDLFGSEVKMLPERKGNRLDAELLTDKTENLGWKPNNNLESFILNFKDSH